MNTKLKTQFRELLIELVDVPEDDIREAEILDLLDKISPDPNYLDYVFDSNEFYDKNENLDIDKVIDKIFSYEPILL